jgi:hypothetical protein
MGISLSARELAQLEPAERGFRSPVPTQIVSNGEFNPLPQTPSSARSKPASTPWRTRTALDRDWTGGSFCARYAVWRRPSSP